MFTSFPVILRPWSISVTPITEPLVSIYCGKRKPRFRGYLSLPRNAIYGVRTAHHSEWMIGDPCNVVTVHLLPHSIRAGKSVQSGALVQ